MTIGFSRGLSVATPKTIRSFHKNLGGHWLALQGADYEGKREGSDDAGDVLLSVILGIFIAEIGG
jgi:hypothetical protein